MTNESNSETLALLRSIAFELRAQGVRIGDIEEPGIEVRKAHVEVLAGLVSDRERLKQELDRLNASMVELSKERSHLVDWAEHKSQELLDLSSCLRSASSALDSAGIEAGGFLARLKLLI